MAQIFSRLTLLALVAVLGCGKSDGRKQVFLVEGRLTYNQQPMAGAMISFHPLDDPDPRALRAHATAKDDGQFRLTTYTTGDGAPAGEYAVTIYWPSKRLARKASPPDDEYEEEPITPDRLNREYADPKTTKLRATVREQPNIIDFALPLPRSSQ